VDNKQTALKVWGNIPRWRGTKGVESYIETEIKTLEKNIKTIKKQIL